MKLAVRGGHNELCPGASARLDEVIEDRKVYAEVINYLRIAGHTVIDCTPQPVASQSSDLMYGVSLANNNGVDLFVSIHFNKAYDNYDGAIGSEVWGYMDAKGSAIANRILANLQALGFKNRGYKDGYAQGYYEIKNTNMTALIVEVCFLEATKDVELYNALGYKRVALAIAEGIHGSKIVVQPPKPVEGVGYCTVNVLNVRTGAGTNYARQGELNMNEKVALLEKKNGWYKVRYYNSTYKMTMTGWVSGSYLRIEKDI